MKKRITSLLLTLAMLHSLLPAMGVTASAAEPEWTIVNSFDDLKTAVKEQKQYIKLGQDIDTTSYNDGTGLLKRDQLTFNDAYYSCTLDLNGKTLALVGNDTNISQGIYIGGYSHLTIQDNSSEKTGTISGAFSNVFGGQKAKLFYVNGGTLTLEGGTFTVTSHPYETNAIVIDSLESFITIKDGVKIIQPEFFDGGYAYDLDGSGYTLKAENSKDRGGSVIIEGGEFDGCVKLTASQAENGSVQISGGTFKKDVQVLYEAEENNSNPAVTVNGGTFEGTVYLKYWPWKTSLYMPYRLNGGTFKGTVNLHTDSGIYEDNNPTGNPNIVRGLDKCFGYSAVVTPDGTFTGSDAYTGVLKKTESGKSYKMSLDGTASNPVRIIPNAWGIIDVTLDGNKIDYAKDWKGTVEEMDNSTAHTIKFTWKGLATELSGKGYSYRVECDRYISGNKTPTTDKNITGTEYSFTIPAGADPKVYSFDLHLNLKKGDKNIGIISNEHIVKLVVNQAEVVVPDPTLAGKVYYTSGIVYGRSISTGTSGLPTDGFDSSKLRYQWQRSKDGGSTWTDIEDATKGKYTPVEADMGDTVRIRVKITANGYLGEIVGMAVKVSKAANDSTPVPSTVVARKDGSDTYTKFEITDFNPNQEYVYTSSPDNSGEWPTGGTPINSATVEGLSAGSTYFIYTRCKETNTHQPGSKIISSSVLLDEETRLNRIILTDASGKEYSSYGNGNTIYIKKGESMTLTATKNPGGANKWSDFTFEPQYSSSAFTVTDPTGPVVSGATITSVTIRGEEVGTGTLAAKYSGYTPRYYGTWGIHVYEDVKDIGTSAEITVSPSFPDTTMYVGDTMTLPEYDVTVYPEGALDNYDLAWRIMKGATYKTSDGNITLENGKIEAKAAHTGSEKTLLGLVAIDKTNTARIISLSPTSRFYVTVTEAPVIELTGLTVAPTKVNLELNKTVELSAVKEPVNAPDSLNWESSNTGVATVDGTGKVTAVAKGEATITVSCGDKKATCTVTVAHKHDTDAQSWVYMDPGTHTKTCTAGDNFKAEAHTFSAWKKVDDTNHSRTCTACKMTDGSVYTETASHNWQWVVDTHATSTTAGKKHEECSDCHAKRNEGTVIPATGGGSSSGGGGGGSAGVTTYAITVQNSKNGGVTASHKSAAKDTAVTLTVTPDKGYVLDTLTVLDSKDKAVKLTEKNGKYTFTMPAGKVTVSAAFKAAAPASENPFTDVPSGAYYEDAVVWAVKKGITSGTSATTFNPDGSCTRAQAVTFLWRAAGSPEPKSAAMPFTDVPAGSYFEKAVLWAVENGITKGTSDTTFGPDASCTRAQIVTFLWRAGGSPAVSGNSAFSDVASDAYYAAAVAWAEKNGVTGGIGGGLFGSDNTCTRAQIVTFLHRAMK